MDRRSSAGELYGRDARKCSLAPGDGVGDAVVYAERGGSGTDRLLEERSGFLDFGSRLRREYSEFVAYTYVCFVRLRVWVLFCQTRCVFLLSFLPAWLVARRLSWFLALLIVRMSSSSRRLLLRRASTSRVRYHCC